MGSKNSAYVDSAIKGIKEYDSDYLIWIYIQKEYHPFCERKKWILSV